MFRLFFLATFIFATTVQADFNSSVKAFWTNNGFQNEARSTPRTLLVDIAQVLLNTGHDIKGLYTPTPYDKASIVISHDLKLSGNMSETLEHQLEYCQPYEIFVVQSLITGPVHFGYDSCLIMCKVNSLWRFNVTTDDTVDENLNDQRIMTTSLTPFINETMIALDILGLLTLHTMAIQQGIQLPIV